MRTVGCPRILCARRLTVGSPTALGGFTIPHAWWRRAGSTSCCVIKKKGTVGIYRFQGEESSRLVFVRQVYEVDVGIYIIYQGKTWDMLPDFDVFQRRTPTGHYYCDACTAPEMFPSRAALWVAHCFEPLLAWANDHLQPSQWLCLFGEPEDSTWAELTSAEDVPARRSRKDLVYACPVVRGTPCHPPRS